MNPVENSITDDNISEEQQSQTDGGELNVRPSLSQVTKSWGFRRTTIARREFMEEVGELSHSPPPVRRGRSRRNIQTPQTSAEGRATRKATCSARSVIDDLEWSSPSSPASEESKPASEASAGGSLDPSLWQDFGSAFHTAFSLLGGNEGLSLDMPDALAAHDTLEDADATKAPSPQGLDETEVPDDVESADEMEVSQPLSPPDGAAAGINDVVLISSQEDDSDEMTLIQIKERLESRGRQGDSKGRGGKGGRGKARGRGRGRGRGKGRGKGRGRGRGRAVELQPNIPDEVDNDDEVMFVGTVEQQQQQEENDPHNPTEIQTSPARSDVTLSPAQRSNSDCIIIDTDMDQVTEVAPGQYDDAPEEEEGEQEEKDRINQGGYSSISDSEGYDSNALYCICRQKHNKRFMICCDSCQDWFHGDCVGIGETLGRNMEKRGQEYVCPPCTTKRQLRPEPALGFPECVTGSLSAGDVEEQHQHQVLKEDVVEDEEQQVEEEEEAPVMRPEPEPEPEPETQTDSSLPQCIGPSCSKQALPDSVYCGTDCILQHAAFTMKTLSGPKVPKSRGRQPKKVAAARPAAKGQRSVRMSKRLAEKAEEEVEEQKMEEDGGEEEAVSPVACDPALTDAQTTPTPSPKFYTASEQSEAITPSTQPPDASAAAAHVVPSSLPVAEPTPPQRVSKEKATEPVNSVSQFQPAETDPSVPPTPEHSGPSPAAQSAASSAPRHHETGALMVTKTSYVIPKKHPAPQPLSASASTSSQKSSPGPMLLNETRNLPVPPAPSAPSSRPSQPNNQVRQSIQRSLTGILFKRVCDCDDLEMSEIDAAKLVSNIEMEMFDVFRNTDSKYMNKYRTIMFNLKDPKNKGLLYRVVRGEISPFRLVRMSQKDMQATKAPEPSAKETPEVKDVAAKTTGLLQKPEEVKVDLPSLNPPRPDRRTGKRPESTAASQEQRRNVPAPAPRSRTIQPGLGSQIPDILTCMLKDTTSEHKAHLFDLKCKICTGQILAGEEEEPAKKKAKVAETREKHEPSWRRYAGGDDSPLQAPPDSPDMDSPTSRLVIDSPALTIVESPASPTMDSPASPTLESPASPVSESPASPTADFPASTSTKRAYAPVVIPVVSTVTITRRDPRTAASRFSTSSSGPSGPRNTTHNQPASYASFKENSSAPPAAPVPSLPPARTLPKSILMKPSSSSDPRLYGASSRTVISESPAEGETAKFLAKQEIVWKGFLNMLNVAKFVTKGYLVSGSAESLKMDLPDTIQIGGRILPETVWDYVAKLKTSVTKELCVIRFHPATEEEEVAYVSLFSYFSSRGRFGVVANSSRSLKDVYLVPLSAKESIPSILQPLEGPGLEKKRPNLLLGLAIIQKTKRPGMLPQEIEEKRPKVHISKDPMWIPKPPVLYGSDKLEMFQPYDPETPSNAIPPASPSCPGSPSDSSSSGSVTIPSFFTSMRVTPVSTPAVVAASTSNNISDKNPTTASSDKTPLQTILKTLFNNKQTDSTASADGSSTTTTTTTTTTPPVRAKNIPGFSQVSGSMVDPIVQRYGQKSKVKAIEEEENDFDRPYDPEDEYDPAMGYGMVAPQKIEKMKIDGPASSGFEEDDIAYDPEDETIFEDVQCDPRVVKAPGPTSDSTSCPTPLPTQVVTPGATATPVQTSTPTAVTPTLLTGTVVVSAATLTEQQRMLEELNKQIEEQKRQLKEQEEALRQQREAVGMFMAHFSVSDSLMSPPSKSLPISQLASLQSGTMQTESRPSESTDKTNNPTETVDKSNVDSQSVKLEADAVLPSLKNDTDTVTEQDETQEHVEDADKYSSAGELEDSDVAYDPEDESLFNLIQDDVFQGTGAKTHDSSGHSSSRKGAPANSHHSRKRRSSPKRRSHHERDCHRSPSRRSQHRSPSHSRRRRERDRHRRSESDRSRHRARNQSERQGRHRKEHATRRHSHGHKRSPSSPRKKDSVSLSPKQHREPSPEVLEISKHASALYNAPESVDVQCVESNTSSLTPVTIKNDPDGHQLKCNLSETPYEDISLHPHKLVHNVKLEIPESPKSHDLQNNSVNASSTQVDNPSQQETLLDNKLDSTVPLREIDPPTRDSPQSPDPEPQFLKSSSIENNESLKTDESRDPETHTSVSMPFVKVEKNCLPIDKQLERESPDLKYPEMLGLMGANLKLARDSDIPGLGPDIDPVSKHVRNPGLDMKERRGSGQQVEFRETGITFPGPDRRGSCLQDMSPNIWGPGSHIRIPGVRSPMQDEGSSMLQGVNPQVEGPGLDMRPGIRGSKLIPTGTNLHVGESVLHSERRDAIMKGPSSGRCGPDTSDSDSRAHLPPLQHPRGPQIEVRAPDVIGRGGVHKERGESPHTGDIRDRSPDIRGPGPFVRGERRFQRHEIYDGSLVCGPGEHFKEPQTVIRAEGSVHGPIMRESETMHEPRRHNMPGGHFMGPGQDMESMVGSDTRDDKNESHAKSSNRDIRDISSNRRHADMQGRNIQVPGLERRNDQMGQKDRGPMPIITNPDWRGQGQGGVGPDMRGQQSQNKNLGPHARVPDLSGPESDRDDCTWPNRRGLGAVTERPSMQDEWMTIQPDRIGPNIETQRPDRGQGGLDILAPGAERRGPDMEVPVHVRRGPGGPDFRRPEPERRDTSLDNLGPDMRRPEVDRRGLALEHPGTDRRGPGGPYFKGLGPERKGPAQAPDMRGHAGADFNGPWPKSRGPEILSPGTDRRGPSGPDFRPVPEGPDFRPVPEGPDFRGPGPERRGPVMEGPGTDRRGPGGPDFRPGPEGPDFRGPGPERRGPVMEVPGTDRRGPVGPDFRPGPEGPDFTGSGPERRGPVMEGPGSDRRRPGGPDFRPGPEGPDFRGPGPERRGPVMEGPGTDRRGPGGPDFRPGPGGPDFRPGPGGPDFRGPGPERRGPVMEGPGTDRRGPGGPDFRPGPSGPDFRGPGPERRGPAMRGPGTDRRGPGGPDFRTPGPETSGPAMEGPGNDWRGHEGPGFRGLGPERRGPEGPDFRGPGSERRGPAMEGPGTDRRGPEDPDFRGPRPERSGPSMEGPGTHRRGPAGPDIRGPGPEFRSLSIEGPGPGRGGPGGVDFRGLGPERRSLSIESSGSESRGPEGSDFSGSGPERRGPVIEGPGIGWRGPVGPDFRGPGPEWRSPAREGPGINMSGPAGPNFRRPAPENRSLSLEGPGRGGPGAPDFRGPGPDRKGHGCPDFRAPGPERRGFVTEGPDKRGSGHPDFQGPGPGRRVPGGTDLSGPGCEGRRRSGNLNSAGLGPEKAGPHMGGSRPNFVVMGPERTGPGMEGPVPHSHGKGGPHLRGPGDRRHPEGANFSGPGPELRPPDMEETENTRNFPGGPQFRNPELERRPPDMEGPEFDRRGPHLRRGGPERTVMEGHGRGPDFRAPGCEFIGPDTENSGPGRRESGGPDFSEPGPERRCRDMEGPGPDWRRSVGPDLRGPGIRQRSPSTEGPRHDRRNDWGRDDFGGSDANQESPIEGQGPDRTGRDLRGRRPIRRNFRGPGPNMSSTNRGDRWRGTDTDEQWSDVTGPNIEAVENEREYSVNHWESHGNRDPRPIQEGPDEQGQESRQGPQSKWRGAGDRGETPIQERRNIQYPGPVRSPRDDWNGPGCRGPARDNPDMMCSGQGPRGEPGNEWREPDRGGAGSNRRGRGAFFRGGRDPDNRTHRLDRRGPGFRGRGSDMKEGPDVENDWRQPGFRGNMSRPNMEGPGAHRGRPHLMNSCPDSRGFEIEGHNRAESGDSDPRRPEPGYRSSNIDGPGTHGRFSDCGGQDADMERHGPGRPGFEDEFRREKRGPDMGRPGQNKSSDIRHGPGRWDTNTEFLGSDRRGPDMMGPGLDSRGSERTMRYSDESASLHFKGPHHPDPALFNGPPGPAPNIGGKSCLGFDSPQNQQSGKPQRHRVALLPTPTEGLIRFPNRMINSSDAFSPKQKQMRSSADRESSRDRAVGRKRALDQEQRDEQEGSPARKISTAVIANTATGKEKREETDKQGMSGASSETKSNQSMNTDGNKINVEPS
ncbi:uncharacterized protein si:ch73-181d5.4 isoform X3 [Scophthalmus maximus]|nr:uncharacterized protein si:ch73-181d5.4 isoform X3 [Scophthalmus maximus]XP_047186775.1 uncharacterized protein si:ch73-181d5.4 isoform X3 [Scophthalmus maximus]